MKTIFKTIFSDSTHRHVVTEAAAGKTSSDDRPLTRIESTKLFKGLISLYGRDRVSVALKMMKDKFGDPVPDEHRDEAIKFLASTLKQYRIAGKPLGGYMG